jgi:thioredoxin reductase (NADPH)
MFDGRNGMEDLYDIAIIGSGPAGISAAITAVVRNKKIILFGSRELSVKLQKAHTIQNYPGFPEISGEELAKRFLEHLDALHIAIEERQVNAIYKTGADYQLQIGQTWIAAHAVILATGVNFGKPYPGEEMFLGRGVSYCATCDAPLYRDKVTAIVAYSPEQEAEAAYMAELASNVYYLPQYEGEVSFAPKEGSCAIKVLHEKPLAIEGAQKAERLVTEQSTIEADGIFLLRESIAPGRLVPGLATDGNYVEVDRSMRTNLEGCFACGDLTGTPYQYSKAVGEGNVAALSAVAYLSNYTQQKEKETTNG